MVSEHVLGREGVVVTGKSERKWGSSVKSCLVTMSSTLGMWDVCG